MVGSAGRMGDCHRVSGLYSLPISLSDSVSSWPSLCSFSFPHSPVAFNFNGIKVLKLFMVEFSVYHVPAPIPSLGFRGYKIWRPPLEEYLEYSLPFTDVSWISSSELHHLWGISLSAPPTQLRFSENWHQNWVLWTLSTPFLIAQYPELLNQWPTGKAGESRHEAMKATKVTGDPWRL